MPDTVSIYAREWSMNNGDGGGRLSKGVGGLSFDAVKIFLIATTILTKVE